MNIQVYNTQPSEMATFYLIFIVGRDTVLFFFFFFVLEAIMATQDRQNQPSTFKNRHQQSRNTQENVFESLVVAVACLLACCDINHKINTA